MAHWGWYWRIKKKHIPKTLCSNLTRLDSFAIYKKAAPDQSASKFFVNPLAITGEKKDGYIQISYGRQRKRPYHIRVDTLNCHYGGSRYYFRCPLCDVRMRFLYLAQHRVFLCRKCLNLSYLTQRLRATQRCLHIADKIRNLISSIGGDAVLGKKPPHMRQKRFAELNKMIEVYSHNAQHETNKELRQWYGAKAEPYLESIYDRKLEKNH